MMCVALNDDRYVSDASLQLGDVNVTGTFQVP